MKANHNYLSNFHPFPRAVYQVKDTIFWKQITTTCPFSVPSTKAVYQVKDTIFWKQITTVQFTYSTPKMLFIKSKIQFFESKSQRVAKLSGYENSCLSSQRYNFLKANHNGIQTPIYSDHAVYQVKDTIFWKQITTVALVGIWSASLFIKSKIQFFESKSQHVTKNSDNPKSCLSSQRYNFLKANHNNSTFITMLILAVYQVKDTIFWKQITTFSHRLGKRWLLFIKSKIQFFESKSQR